MIHFGWGGPAVVQKCTRQVFISLDANPTELIWIRSLSEVLCPVRGNKSFMSQTVTYDDDLFPMCVPRMSQVLRNKNTEIVARASTLISV